MAPTSRLIVRQTAPEDWNWRSVASDEDLVIESWSEGFLVGALVIMAALTIASMRRGILLHKLILAEQLFALSHGTFCFMDFNGYGWYLSSTATLLYLSYILHNVVAWMKVKPFFHGRSTIFSPPVTKWTTRIYLVSLACTVPPILFQISDNFRFFNGGHGWYKQVRPYEPLMRDPWWVFCCGVLFYVLSKSYGMGVITIVKKSPRFGILFAAIILAVIFTVFDIVSSIDSFIGSTDGINPFWKLSLVFKCLTDAILLDDFKTELRRLGLQRLKRDEKRRQSHALVLDDDYTQDSDDESYANYSNGNADPNAFTNDHPPSSVSVTRKAEGNFEGAQQVEFSQALNLNPSQSDTNWSSSRRSSGGRPQVARGGVKASKLPKLFSAVKLKNKKPKSTSDIQDFAEKPDEHEEEDEEVRAHRKGKQRSSEEDTIAANEISFEDDHLEQARRMNADTITELSRRKSSTAALRNGTDNEYISASTSRSPDAIERARRERRKQSSHFFDDLDDLDEL